MSLRDLYQEMIIDHGKKPRNFGKLPNASHSHQGHNPLCGDQCIVYLVERDQQIKAIQFEGSGCAISVASASLMTEAIKGKTINEIVDLFNRFQQLVTGHESNQDLGKLEIFSGVAAFPARVKCATLAWHTLKAALNRDVQLVCTE